MKFIYIIFYILVLLSLASAATIGIEELEMTSFGSGTYEQFGFSTYGSFSLYASGGLKYSAKIGFSFYQLNIERMFSEEAASFYQNMGLKFKYGIVSLVNIFSSPLSISYWVGKYEHLGTSGNYKGYISVPSTTDYSYFYKMNGTGFTFTLQFFEDRFKIKHFFYQNGNFKDENGNFEMGHFSFDGQFGFYSELVSVELFGGYTYPFAEYGSWKSGVTLNVGNEYVQFLTTAGVPRFQHTMSLSDFYIITELSFRLYFIKNVFSFFTRPLYYNEDYTGITTEREDFDINNDLNFFYEDFPLNGGIVLNYKYNPPEDLSKTTALVLSPYLNLYTSGVIWNFKTNFDVLNAITATDFFSIFTISLNIRTSF